MSKTLKYMIIKPGKKTKSLKCECTDFNMVELDKYDIIYCVYFHPTYNVCLWVFVYKSQRV